MTKVEKIILGTIIVLVLGVAAMTSYAVHKVNEAGGLSQVFIDAGKEVKRIGKEIDKE